MKTITFPYQTIRDIDVADKTILLRADYNVPLRDDGSVADDFRVAASIPTLEYLLKRNAKVVIISHLGRPKGERNAKYSLRPVVDILRNYLKREIKFVDDCIGAEVASVVDNSSGGNVIVLENLRFYKSETDNDEDFARKLAKDSRAEIFVQDGFGVVHRPHASTESITKQLPSVAGLLLEKEYVAIKTAIDAPNRPLTTIIGGAKISDKMPLVKKFIDIADNIVVGGALANNFIKRQGYKIGNSLVEDGVEDLVDSISFGVRSKYGRNVNSHFILPMDVAISETGELADAPRVEMDLKGINPPAVIYDIGEKTIREIEDVIGRSGTVIWNGTLGMAEYPEFSRGSARIAMALAQKPQIASIIGGGDTADFVRNWDALHGGSFTHVSTGGGASLELMSGMDLPGITALTPR